MSINISSIINITANKIFPQDEIYVDNNAWVDIAFNRQYGRATENYLKDFIALPQSPLILFSPHSKHEIFESLHADEFQKEANARGIVGSSAWKSLEKQISGSNDSKIINQKILQRYEKFLYDFEGFIYPIEQIDIEPTVDEIYKLYGIPYKDAKHLAYMWHEETNNLLTRDGGLKKVPGLNIFSPQLSSNRANIIQPFSSFLPELPNSLRNK